MRRATARWLYALLIAALILALPAAPSFGHGPAAPFAQSSVAASERAKAEQLTLELANLNGRYHAGSPSQRGSLETQMLLVAQSRRQSLSALLNGDPAE